MLSILAATSMPAGKVGAQPAPVGAGKSVLSTGTEAAAGESSTATHPAESNFQQAFSSALRDSPVPLQQSEKAHPITTPQPMTGTPVSSKTVVDTKSGDSSAPQIPVSGSQLVASVNSVIAGMLSASVPTSSRDSKTPAAVSLPALKEQGPSKSKTASQSEPVAPNPTPDTTDSQNAALASSVTGALAAITPQIQLQPVGSGPGSSGPASSPEQTSQPSAPSVRDLPVVPPVEIHAVSTEASAPAEPALSAAHAPVQSVQPAADSLSFAMLLHPKMAQGPITSTQSVPVVKQTPESRISTSSIGSAVSSRPVVTTPPVVNPSPAPASTQATPAQGESQPSVNATTALQSHSGQDSASSDPPPRGKTEGTADSSPAALQGISDAVKPVITASVTIPNSNVTPAKATEAVSATPLAAQVSNAQNQTPPPVAKEVVVRLQGQSGEAISVRLVDQGGQVQVAVRSSDPATANLLRQDLSLLTNNLDRAGWKPEVLTSAPAAASFVQETSQGSGHDGQNPQGQGQGTLDWNQQDGSRRRSTVADLWDEILTRQGT